MNAPSKATVFIKEVPEPVVIDNFQQVLVTSAASEPFVRKVPEQIPIVPNCSYVFSGSSSCLAASGSEIQAVFFE